MRPALGLFLALTISACTADDGTRPSTSAAARGEQCFRAAAVSDFTPVRGEDAVDVRVGSNRHYRLDLGPGCFDVDWANRVALRSRTGGYVCGAADADLVIPSFGARRADRCSVVGVRRLSDAEVEAARQARRN